jgi:LysM repeat protein
VLLGVSAGLLAFAVAVPAGATEHTVGTGENLTAIAARYCTSVRDLVARNGVSDPNLIHVGTRLEVDHRCAAAASGPSAAPANPPAAAVPDEAQEIESLLHLVPVFRAAAEEFTVPTDLLMALTFTESRWRADRVSRSGAVGIGQLLPDTASWLRELMGEPDLDEGEPVDNVRMSARLLRFLLDRTASSAGDRPRLALAAYFQGIGDVLRNGIDVGGDYYADVVMDRRTWFADL